MTTQEIKSKFYFAIEQNQAGQLPEAKEICLHLYGCVQEISDAIPATDEHAQYEAGLDRSEMRSTLRQLGVEVEY